MKIFKQISPKNRLILLIFIFAFFSRLLVQPYFIMEKKDFADGLDYNSYAIVEILNDKGWAEKNSDEIDNLRAPGYPLFLALIYFLFGIENFKMVYLFQTVLSLWLAYFAYRLSYQIFNNENIPSRQEVIENLVPYIRAELKRGTRLNQIMRHTLGLFHGQSGASYWKRYLSENMCVRDADVQKIDHIMDKIKYNNIEKRVG